MFWHFYPQVRLSFMLLILFVIIGNVISKQTQAQLKFAHNLDAPITIRAERMILKQGATYAYFENNVRIEQGKFSLAGDKMKLTQNDVKSMHFALDGHVTMQSDDGTMVYGTHAYYDIGAKSLVINGNVRVVHLPDNNRTEFIGTRLTIDMISGRGTLTGQQSGATERVRGIFTPPAPR